MINKDWGGQFLDFTGGHSCYEGVIELMGDPSVPTPGKTLESKLESEPLVLRFNPNKMNP